MTTDATSNANDLFRQAVETFQSAIRTGVKIQEESAKRFAEMLRDLSAPTDWQKSTQTMLNEAIGATQRNIDESIRLMNHNAQSAMSMLHKAFENRTAAATTNGSTSADELWESALSAMRTNTQVILQANARILESWAHLAQELTSGIVDAQKDMAEKVSK